MALGLGDDVTEALAVAVCDELEVLDTSFASYVPEARDTSNIIHRRNLIYCF